MALFSLLEASDMQFQKLVVVHFIYFIVVKNEHIICSNEHHEVHSVFTNMIDLTLFSI